MLLLFSLQTPLAIMCVGGETHDNEWINYVKATVCLCQPDEAAVCRGIGDVEETLPFTKVRLD